MIEQLLSSTLSLSVAREGTQDEVKGHTGVRGHYTRQPPAPPPLEPPQPRIRTGARKYFQLNATLPQSLVKRKVPKNLAQSKSFIFYKSFKPIILLIQIFHTFSLLSQLETNGLNTLKKPKKKKLN